MTRTTTPNTGFIYGVDGVNSLVIASAGPDASEDSSAESDQAQSPKVWSPTGLIDGLKFTWRTVISNPTHQAFLFVDIKSSSHLI
ncbi:hypothetical protein HRR90_008693 [Exophiala dermatitidis]|nr:hypothetical protein HRR74_008549 [Exophiala dermatitidis]KAJ4563700.1 hypothetical protein HRR81_008535 [Exophiala dermatitidis]KAJ4603604.1 hypothetical protein HRR85_008660 [Exophiala dermatitidis]KAJ4641676.1 hypothetical protein HRR90_008693 [Exophiala dermatitidis]KAJ4644779.1 hypothetical protein HRR91_007206 [Exophiala dermatitidis]